MQTEKIKSFVAFCHETLGVPLSQEQLDMVKSLPLNCRDQTGKTISCSFVIQKTMKNLLCKMNSKS